MAAFDGENEVYKQLPPYPEQQQAQHDWADYWTVDRVLRWLDVNEFKPAIDLFKGKEGISTPFTSSLTFTPIFLILFCYISICLFLLFFSFLFFFIAKHICGKTFLDIDMAYLMSFSNDLALTYTDKRKLAHAIKSLRTVSKGLVSMRVIK
jgi:hypothetical protein